MSNGGAECITTKETEAGSGNASTRPKADDFGRAVSKIAVAQICESVGFESFNDSALEALADVTIRYLRDLGKTASFHANLAGRTECNVFDIIHGLEEMKAPEGFLGFSGVGDCIASSGVVKEILEYVEVTEEIPFCQPVPSFPVVRSRKLVPSFLQMGETPPSKHIPSWLPAFPDPHTYIHTPMWNERKTEPRADKIEQARQRRKAERSLLNLQQRLVCSASAEPGAGSSVPVVSDGGKKALSATTEKNPFLTGPLKFGQQEVSPVVLPAKLLDEAGEKDHASVLDAFAPAIEALKSGGPDDGETEKKSIPEKRPAVYFKFNTGKKFVGETLDLNLQKKDNGRTASWFGREEEKDEKKRRAEYILRNSMENPQELTQL